MINDVNIINDLCFNIFERFGLIWFETSHQSEGQEKRHCAPLELTRSGDVQKGRADAGARPTDGDLWKVNPPIWW